MAEIKTPEKKTDALPIVAITLGVAGVGTGLYFWMKKPPKEVKEGEWAEANTILVRRTFKVTVVALQGWQPAYKELARLPFRATITTPVIADWREAYATLAQGDFHVEIVPPLVSDWKPEHANLAQAPFQVTISQAEAIYILDIASDPIYAGWVTTNPEKPLYAYGEIVEVTAHRIWPYEFTYWDADGERLGNANPIYFMILGSHRLTAHFG